MLWLRWQQHKADSAEARAIRRYLERRAAHRVLWQTIVEAQHRAEAWWRLELALLSGTVREVGAESTPRR